MLSENIMFINTNYWDNISKNELMRICSHEAIPGHIVERKNTTEKIKRRNLFEQHN